MLEKCALVSISTIASTTPRVAEDAKSDGVFPLITNVVDISELELLKTYKRQPTIEKSGFPS